MKKYWNKLALLLCLLAGFGLAFTGCSSGDDDGGSSSSTCDPNSGSESVTDSGVIEVTAPSTAGAVVMVADSDTSTKLYEGTSVQDALAYLMTNSLSESYTISVAAGTYEEMLFYTGAASITIEGTGTAEYGTDVLITYNNSGNTNSMQSLCNTYSITNGYFRGATRFNGTCNLTLKNVTIQNSYSRSEDNGSSTQAEALVFSSTGNMIAYNSTFLSHQDTLYLGQKGGRIWFYKSYISGDVDFIWGYMDVALFEECSIYCRGDETTKSYIFASRSMVEDEANKGIVLLNNNIEIASGVTGWYGRNSGADTQAAILNSTITGAGTLNSNLYQSAPTKYVEDAAGDLAIGYKDYNNTMNGTLVDTSSRLTLCGELSERVANREYNGRYVILNRGYDEDAEQYVTASTIWDISEYEEEFSATEDTSADNVYVDPVYAKNIVGGNTVQLTPSSDVDGLTYTYASSDESLATVDANGLVTTIAGADGTATITMTASNGNTDTMGVKVIPEEISATAVSVSLADSSVAKYGITTATITFEPADTTDQTFTLTSSDSSVKFYEAGSGLVTSTTVEAEDGSAEVYVWVSGEATLTATSTAYTSATAGTATASVTENEFTWLAQPGSYRMGTDIQKGTNGLWDGLVINSTALSSSWTGKMSLKSYPTMQIRNLTLYIPVEGASTITLNHSGALSDGMSYEVDGTAFTVSSDDETVYTYTYDGSATGIVLGSTLSGLTFAKTVGDNISANDKYLQVSVIGGDRYLTSIDVETTGDFTATWEETTATGASGTYTLSDSSVSQGTALEDGTSSDGFVSWSGLYSNGNEYAYTSADSEVTVQVAGSSIVTLTGCYNGTNGKTLTVTDSDGNTVVSGVYTSSDQTLTFLYSGDATTLTITWSGYAYITAVKVVDGTGVSDTISAVTISGTTTCAVSATTTLSATVSCSYINTDTSVTWASSDTDVATVDEDGVVTGVAAGTATITATSTTDTSVSGTATVTVTASAATAEVGSIYTWNFVGLSAVPSTVSDSEGNGINLTIAATTEGSSLSNNGGYGLYGTEATYSFPVAGDATIIAYATYLNTSSEVTLSLATDDGTAVGTDQTLLKSDTLWGSSSDHKPANGPVAYVWRYTGDADTLVLTVPAKVYMGQIVADNTASETALTACSYDFTDSAMATPLAPSAGSNKIHWYGSATAGYKNSTYGIQTYGATFFTFYVGGACDITFTDTYDSGVTDTVYLYEAGNSTAVASQTLTGAVTSATNYTLSYEGTTPTVLRLRVPKNVYISTITVE